jgi:hypothetical protein
MAKFIRFNGWDKRDLECMYANPGYSSGMADTYSESDKDLHYEYDPSKKKAIPAVELEERFKIIIDSTVVCMLGVAKQMTHKSVCIIYGRDMYPVCEVIRVLGYKLRGTYIYIEGASRYTSSEEVFRKRFADEFSPIFEKADKVIGFDTGYQGTIPSNMIRKNPHIAKSVKDKHVIRLMAATSDPKEHCIFRDYIDTDSQYHWKNVVSYLEDFYKPITRPTRVYKNMPILNVADKESIEKTYALLGLIAAKCKELEPILSYLLHPEIDIVDELLSLKKKVEVKLEEKKEEAKTDIDPLFKPGVKVKLKESSKYYDQYKKYGDHSFGVIQEDSCDTSWVEVKWPIDNQEFCYPKEDLIIVNGFAVGDKIKPKANAPYLMIVGSWRGEVIGVDSDMCSDKLQVSGGYFVDEDFFELDI